MLTSLNSARRVLIKNTCPFFGEGGNNVVWSPGLGPLAKPSIDQLPTEYNIVLELRNGKIEEYQYSGTWQKI